jgi:hypothetical protein
VREFTLNLACTQAKNEGLTRLALFDEDIRALARECEASFVPGPIRFLPEYSHRHRPVRTLKLITLPDGRLDYASVESRRT